MLGVVKQWGMSRWRRQHRWVVWPRVCQLTTLDQVTAADVDKQRVRLKESCRQLWCMRWTTHQASRRPASTWCIVCSEGWTRARPSRAGRPRTMLGPLSRRTFRGSSLNVSFGVQQNIATHHRGHRCQESRTGCQPSLCGQTYLCLACGLAGRVGGDHTHAVRLEQARSLTTQSTVAKQANGTAKRAACVVGFATEVGFGLAPVLLLL